MADFAKHIISEEGRAKHLRSHKPVLAEPAPSHRQLRLDSSQWLILALRRMTREEGQQWTEEALARLA